MNLFGGMKIYTVHIKPGSTHAQDKPIFLREGFNWPAFLFGAFWALYHRLWLPALYIFLADAMVMMFDKENIFSMPILAVLQLGVHVLVGFHANDWRRTKLAKDGYILSDITASDSLLRAEQRYFERYLAHSTR